MNLEEMNPHHQNNCAKLDIMISSDSGYVFKMKSSFTRTNLSKEVLKEMTWSMQESDELGRFVAWK